MTPPLQISPEALEAFRQRLVKRGTPAAAIRLGIRGGSCSGFAYVIEFDDGEPKARDTTWDIDGVSFRVDKKSQLYLSGSRIGWKQTLMYQGFEFENPNEASRCGCGSSFSPK